MTDFDTLWNFNDPASTEQQFLELQPEFSSQPEKLAELLTQIARTQGLQRRFDEAHATLDEAAKILTPESESRAQVRYFLERGRVFRSSKNPDLAKPLFLQAFELSRQLHEDVLSIDAAHMLAILEQGEKALEWYFLALELARNSQDERARAWKASLLNNIAWALHDSGRFQESLELFQETVQLHAQNPEKQRIARWSEARVLRSLQKYPEALAIQHELLEQLKIQGQSDGYVSEEVAENLLSLEKPVEARVHFARAHELLLQDAWFCESEPLRLERLKRQANP